MRVLTHLNSYTSKDNLEMAYEAFFAQLREHAIEVIPCVGRDDMVCLTLEVNLRKEKSDELLKVATP
jgi:hypothetical protein